MPVDQRFSVELIGEIDAKLLAGIEDQPCAACGVGQPVKLGRAAIDVERAGGGGEGRHRALRPG